MWNKVKEALRKVWVWVQKGKRPLIVLGLLALLSVILFQRVCVNRHENADLKAQLKLDKAAFETALDNQKKELKAKDKLIAEKDKSILERDHKISDLESDRIRDHKALAVAQAALTSLPADALASRLNGFMQAVEEKTWKAMATGVDFTVGRMGANRTGSIFLERDTLLGDVKKVELQRDEAQGKYEDSNAKFEAEKKAHGTTQTTLDACQTLNNDHEKREKDLARQVSAARWKGRRKGRGLLIGGPLLATT
jgi:hypothetical protein